MKFLLGATLISVKLINFKISQHNFLFNASFQLNCMEADLK